MQYQQTLHVTCLLRVTMLSTTAFLAIAMQCTASIHPSTAFDVARVESGFNPYAIAEIVPKAGPLRRSTHYFSPASQPGRCRAYSPSPVSTGSPLLCRVDANHQHQFPPLWLCPPQSYFDPCTNLSVFEHILRDCYRRGGTLKRAELLLFRQFQYRATT